MTHVKTGVHAQNLRGRCEQRRTLFGRWQTLEQRFDIDRGKQSGIGKTARQTSRRRLRYGDERAITESERKESIGPEVCCVVEMNVQGAVSTDTPRRVVSDSQGVERMGYPRRLAVLEGRNVVQVQGRFESGNTLVQRLDIWYVIWCGHVVAAVGCIALQAAANP